MVAPADLAVAAFTLCNLVRVVGYVPQIVRIGQDQQGATAISYTTWSIFAASHSSTVAYAVFAVGDWRMAAVFGANTLCCVAILALTAWKRSVYRAARPPATAPARAVAPAFRMHIVSALTASRIRSAVRNVSVGRTTSGVAQGR